MSRLGRRGAFDTRSMAASVGLHIVALVLAWASTLTAREPMHFEAIQVELVSPPTTVQAEVAAPATEDLVVERPDPVPPEPRPDPQPERVTQPEPKKPDPPKEPEKRVEEPKPAEERKPAAKPEVVPEKARESGENINVRLQGVIRDFPEYYGNIVNQITRCFHARWRGGGSWETTMHFVIRRDGKVSEIEFAKRSGSTQFDFAAMEAVECAGQGRFGPLPEELPFDRLPVQFDFRPSGEPRMQILQDGPMAEAART